MQYSYYIILPYAEKGIHKQEIPRRTNLPSFLTIAFSLK
jgi:hypothetical protein